MDYNFNFKAPQKYQTASDSTGLNPTFPYNATSRNSMDASIMSYKTPHASEPTDSLLNEAEPFSLASASGSGDSDKNTVTSTTAPAAALRTYKRQKDFASIHRNETTRRVEKEILRVCKWENPARSFFILVSLVGSIILTGRYSLIQLVSCLLTLTISANLGYILLNQFSHAAVSDEPSINPYNQILSNQHKQYLSKDDVAKFNSAAVDVVETIAKALTRIVLIEDMKTSLKWLAIFFVTWRVSTVVSSRSIILFFIASSFIFPRLYISNKDIIDARVRQGHTILSSKVTRTQTLAKEKLANVTAATMHYVHNKKQRMQASSAASSVNREATVQASNN